MDASKTDILDLLIVGAGPVGLTAALEAIRLGLSVRIVDRKSERTIKDSRAVVVHPRVMELLRPIRDGALTKEINDNSFPLQGVNGYLPDFWGRFPGFGGSRAAPATENEHSDPQSYTDENSVVVDFSKVDWGDTEFPTLRFLPQYETERILEEALIALGGRVEYGTTLEDLQQEENGVVRSTMIDTTTTTEEKQQLQTTVVVESRWVLGADGGRSKTRELIGVELTRHRSDLYFVVADVVLKGDRIPLNSHERSRSGHMFPYVPIAMIPLPGENSFRLMGKAPDGITSPDDATLDEKFFKDYLQDKTGKSFDDIELGDWRTVFEITHGTTECYRKGNVMLAGDAAHVHSPVGGQGMNLGIQDSNNLLWKLAWSKRLLQRASSLRSEDDNAAVEANRIVDNILETYQSERMGLGREIVRSVEITTRMLGLDSSIVKFFQSLLIRYLLPSDYGLKNIRKIGQLELAYQPSWSSLILEGPSSYWQSWTTPSYICVPGQRLPNIRLKDGSRLYSHIDRTKFTWVVLNHPPTTTDATPAAEDGVVRVVAASADEQISSPTISETAYASQQVILVRPDQFVAGVDTSMSVLKDRLKETGLTETAVQTM